MNFEWNADKCDANIAKHGIDFADACAIWRSDRIDPYYQRVIDNETRRVALGIVMDDEVIIAVVYARRNATVRIISARRARRYERQDYQDQFGRGV